MATENFGFKTLLGSDTAGYTSINSLIDSIDSVLRQRVFNKPADAGASADDVMIFSGAWGSSSGYWTSGKINTSNIADNAVTTGKIVSSAITTARLNNLAVTSDKLAEGSVIAGKLASNSVLSANIADGQVTAAKLEAGLTTQVLPSGMIAPFAGNPTEPPSGWFYCRGQREPRASYPGLDQAIGITYGPYTAADGSPGDTHFQLPDLQSRIPVGFSSEAEFNSPGKTGGVKEVTLTAAQSGIAAHAHTVGASNSGVTGTNNTVGYSIQTSNPNHGHTTGAENATHTHTTAFKTHPVASGTATTALVGPGASFTGTTTYTSAGQSANHAHTVINDANVTHSHVINNDGHTHNVQINNAAPADAGQAHNNLQPYITLNYIIKI